MHAIQVPGSLAFRPNGFKVPGEVGLGQRIAQSARQDAKQAAGLADVIGDCDSTESAHTIEIDQLRNGQSAIAKGGMHMHIDKHRPILPGRSEHLRQLPVRERLGLDFSHFSFSNLVEMASIGQTVTRNGNLIFADGLSRRLARGTKVQPGTRVAAVDVGSNAIRLAIGEVGKDGDVKLLKKYREGVRLGHDTFSQGTISKKTMLRAIESFAKFRQLLKENRVQLVRGVATSALREAKNRQVFVDEVLKQTGIAIDVIDGLEEGRLIFSAVSRRVELAGARSVLIDIGGGSVELTVVEGMRARASRSFPLGTVRMIEQVRDLKLKEKHLPGLIEQYMRPVRGFLRENLRGKRVHFAIGTGGNFECLAKLRVALLSKTSIYSMTFDELSELTEHLASMSVKDRIRFLRLRADRADVVVPAALVTLAIMECIPTDTLHVPYVGLREGLLLSLINP